MKNIFYSVFDKDNTKKNNNNKNNVYFNYIYFKKKKKKKIYITWGKYGHLMEKVIFDPAYKCFLCVFFLDQYDAKL